MPPKTLSDVEADVDATGLARLGMAITYLIGGATRVPNCYALIDHSDKTLALTGSQLTDQDIEIEVLMSDVAEPSSDDRITLPRITGVTFKPRDWRRSPSGRMWLIFLAKVR